MKVAQLCPTLCDLTDYSPWNSPGQNTGVGSLSLLQGIFPTQGSNPGLPCGSAGKESTCNAGDLGLIPGLGKSPGEGKGYPFQYSGLENSMDCIVHGVAKSQTRLSTVINYFRQKSSMNVKTSSNIWRNYKVSMLSWSISPQNTYWLFSIVKWLISTWQLHRGRRSNRHVWRRQVDRTHLETQGMSPARCQASRAICI